MKPQESIDPDGPICDNIITPYLNPNILRLSMLLAFIAFY